MRKILFTFGLALSFFAGCLADTEVLDDLDQAPSNWMLHSIVSTSSRIARWDVIPMSLGAMS